jgi:threonine dehydrogenase-like Zn-dependent dehydrogenase
MNAIVNTAPNCLEWRQLPTPQPVAGWVRIRSAACAICGTDMEMISGWERTGFPSVPGHEWSGIVDAVGDKKDEHLLGRHCVGDNILKDGGEVGFEHPGAYGQYFLTEAEKLHLLSKEFPLDAAALIEPLAVSSRAVRRLRQDFAEPVLVFGDGPIGLIILMLLVREQAKDITLVGGRDKRLALAEDLGAKKTINYHRLQSGLLEEIQRHGHREFGAIIEASGSAAAADAAVHLAACCGRILIIGDYKKAKTDFLWNRLLHQQIELIGSNCGTDAWPEAVNLAVKKEIAIEKLISHRFPSENFQQAFELVRSKGSDVIKVVLQWEPFCKGQR